MKNLTLIRDFFPFRLLSAHVKYNFFGLIYWVLLFGIVSGNLASFFGVPFLFYAPEYHGQLSFFSFFLLQSNYVDSVIIGVKNQNQLNQNLSSLNFKIDKNSVRQILKIF